MTTLTVNIENKKTEKAVKAMFDALGLNYEIEASSKKTYEHPLNKAELALYKRLKKSLDEIKLHQEGKIQLKTLEDVIAELS